MIRRPPRSTRTDTLFPYTTLFRSHPAVEGRDQLVQDVVGELEAVALGREAQLVGAEGSRPPAHHQRPLVRSAGWGSSCPAERVAMCATNVRSEERRVGKECVRTCRSRWSPYH